MSSFEKAIQSVLANEGGYVHNPNDPGGETNFGISKRQHPQVDIKNLTKEAATEIYRADYWKPIYDKIQTQHLATKLLDLSVLSGKGTATSFFQSAIVDVGPYIPIDGSFGPATLKACNECNPTDLDHSFGNIMARYHYKIAHDRITSGRYDRATVAQHLYSWIKRDFA